MMELFQFLAINYFHKKVHYRCLSGSKYVSTEKNIFADINHAFSLTQFLHKYFIETKE